MIAPPMREFWTAAMTRGRALEDRVGLAVSLPLCIIVLLSLNFVEIDKTFIDPPPLETLIDFSQPEAPQLVEPPPIPEEAVPAPPPPAAVEENVATRENSTEDGKEIVDPEAGVTDASLSAPSPEEPASLQNWKPNDADAADLRTIDRELNAKANNLKSRQNSLQESIVRAEVKSAAKNFKTGSDGGSAGEIRLLDIESFPTDQVIPVLNRYGITYERRHTKPSGGRSFLNAAQTESGTFHAIEKEGYYQVLSLSPKAVAMMATREVTAMQARNFDPKTTRVTKVTFGMVKNKDGELDLDVVDLQVERY
ncbi:hypothetical protein BH09SUM1_BH09SUM1_00050 [soil metagenome]